MAVAVDLTDDRVVALLAEGVDRNHEDADTALMEAVALLAEGVDRNCLAVHRPA